MSSDTVTSASHLSWFANLLNQQRREGEFCDVLLDIGGRTLPTHSCVLSACSPYFRRLIVSERPHAQHLITSGNVIQQIVLDLPGLSDDVTDAVLDSLSPSRLFEAVSGLLDFVYTGRIELREADVDLVVRLAETLALEGLTELVRSRFNREIVAVDSAGGGMVPGSESELGKARNRKRKASSQTVPISSRSPTMPSPSVRPVRPNHKRRTPLAQPLQQPANTIRTPTRPASDTCTRVLRSRRPAAEELPDDPPADPPDDPLGGSLVDQPPAVHPPSITSQPRKKYKFSCYQCKFVSRHLVAIRAHKQIHPGRTYECRACSYITGRWPKLLAHLLDAQHAETRCSLCEHEAEDAVALGGHLRRHGDDPTRPFFCEFCEARFDCRSSLSAHVTKHTSDRPFVCDVCHRAFKQKGPLQAHMVTHADVKGFLCEQCGFRTAYKYHLRMHERTHNGNFLRCTYLGCTYQTIYEPSLQTHLATHTKTKLYQCEVCGQSFALKQSLGRHSKLHDAAANLLHCSICPYTSTRRDKLRDHHRKSHGASPDQHQLAVT